ncbi:hypothetical protein MAMC_00741 [Methylacidimicrobium cyclopophantes]|uniref:Uncharacterized protein n=1 Tax=Methylacidimicrobium cyclopophantes TaxID=1041766 RepID=A0A5E6MBH7_9BACT|nr:hypothetical protein [Methylacidimicrobium cyclopophantes]VVM05664.1 hypothetical protein MAMC_00741 [Methylacidimicrobium cyclopophantes]
MEEHPVLARDSCATATNLADQIEKAFRYRGDVTLRLRGGRHLTGFVYNRFGEGADAFVEVMLSEGAGSVSISAREIEEIVFSGPDAADGKSYEAWKAKKNKERKQEAEKIASEMRRQGFL